MKTSKLAFITLFSAILILGFTLTTDTAQAASWSVSLGHGGHGGSHGGYSHGFRGYRGFRSLHYGSHIDYIPVRHGCHVDYLPVRHRRFH